MRSNKLRFGVSYCPYAKSKDVDMKYWDRDFQTMKELNFNTLRCFVSWDRIEQEEGVYDFSKTDYIFELANKYNMDVILNIGGVFDCYGGIYAPRWLIYDYNCQQIIENPNVDFKPFGSMPLLCPDDPIFTSKANNFTIRAIKRYADQPQLCGWNVWNEPALNHMCYCPCTMNNFRDWLKTRYRNNLDKLNSEWGSEYPVNYRNWDMIEPGLGAGFLAGGHVARLDWMKFNREKVTGWVNGVNSLVHKFDHNNHPTTCNVVGTAAMDVKSLNAPDIWSQNHDLDIGGISFYGHDFSSSDSSYYLSNARSSSADPGKSFWILETCAGQQFSPELRPGDCCDREFRTLMNWQSVLHGAKTTLLWKFGGRISDNQTDCYNLTGWDGGITERALNNAKFAKTLLENEALFLDTSYQASVAVLTSSNASIFNIVDNSMTSYEKSKLSRFGAYRVLRDLHIQTDLISEVLIGEGKLSNYRALVIPWCEVMSPQLAKSIAKFVSNGGIVIADRCLNLKEENSCIHYRAPGNGLNEIFGAYINDMLLTAEDEKILTANGKIPVRCHRHAMLHPADNAKVVGTYKNGTPAAVVNCYGQGKTLWFGSDIFYDYNNIPCEENAEMIAQFLNDNGISSDYEITGNADDVEFGALTSKNGEKIHFVLNMSGQERSFNLTIKSAEKQYHDLLSDFIYKGNSKLIISPYEVKILH